MKLGLAGMMLLTVACGDDVTPADATGTETDPSTTGEASTSSSTGSITTTIDPGTTTDVEGTTTSSSSGVVDDSSSSSSTGEPNEDPLAFADLYLTNTMERTLTADAAGGLLANDEDPDGDTLSIEDADAISSAGATVDVAEDGSFTYTAADPFWGEDSFSYTVSDGRGGTATSTVRVVVAPTTEGLDEVGPATAGFAIAPEASGDEAGISVAIGGDINGDGFADIVVGAEDAGASDEGAAYVVFGKADNTEVDLAAVAGGAGGFVINGETGQPGTGFSVSVAGDVNGDGLADVVIGAADESSGSGAYVVFGKTDTTAVDLSAVAVGTGGFAIVDPGNASVGFSVAGAGDVNGDGRKDLIIGTPEFDADAGRVAVVFGRGETTPVDLSALGAAGFFIEGFPANAAAGRAVSSAGDFDGDGLDDVIIGARGANGGQGLAAIVLGRTETTTVLLADLALGTGGKVIGGVDGVDNAGQAVACAGDVNGDGRYDVVIGAWGAAPEDLNASGSAYVVHGTTDMSATTTDAVLGGVGGFGIEGQSDFDFMGWAVGGLGDVNADGLSDVLIGAQGADFGGGTSGRAYVIYGRTETTAVIAADLELGLGGFVLDGDGLNANAGYAAGGGGDVNGDSFADIVVGSPGASLAPGMAHVAFGGDYLALTPGHSTGADTIVGTDGDDILTGGAGDDELQSAGGFDVIYGGAGDDTIVLPDVTLFRIDGGLGRDTIRLDGADLSFDLDNYFEVALRGIEVLDITGSGDNSLFMGGADVRAMLSDSNRLEILGDDGDQLIVDLTGGGFIDLGSDGTVTTYSNGVLNLVVDDAIEVFATL